MSMNGSGNRRIALLRIAAGIVPRAKTLEEAERTVGLVIAVASRFDSFAFHGPPIPAPLADVIELSPGGSE